jgi:glycopeptide antibiotics resistance protein
MGENSSEKKQRIIFAVFLVAYATFILFFTVWSRPVQPQAPELELFWSYRQWFAGDQALGREIILNICMFIPIGFFAAGLFSNVRKRILIAVLMGIILSALVEVLQLYLGRGLFEFDDIFNNAIGSAVGGAAYMILLQPGGSLKSGTE